MNGPAAGDSRNGRLIAAALILMIGAVGGALLAINADGVSEHWTLLGTTLLVFGLPGMVGGLAAGGWSGTLKMPGGGEDGGVRLGFLGDALLGVIGGYAIFLLLPDKFNAPTDVTSYAKTFALAAIGGVAARPLIEKLRTQFLAEKLEEVRQTSDQNKHDGHAVAITDAQLEAAQPQEEPGYERLRSAYAAASEDGRTRAFKAARERAKLLRKKKRGLKELSAQDSAALGRAAVVFRALIDAGEHPFLHRFWGQLAYARNALGQWDDGLAALDEAIRARDDARVPGYTIYEFNRAQARLFRARAAAPTAASLDLGSDRARIIVDLRLGARDPVLGDAIRKMLSTQVLDEADDKELRTALGLIGLKTMDDLG